MRLSGLVVVFSFLLVSTVRFPAAAAEPGPPPPCNLSNKVVYLDPNHPTKASDNFGGYGASYKKPRPVTVSVDPGYRRDLETAFEIAPAYLKQALCRMNYIFIDRNNDPYAPLGWGFWEGPSQGTGKEQFIGISEQFWTVYNGPTLAGLETSILQRFLPNWPRPRPLPPFVNVSPVHNNRAMAVLALVTHEVAHVSFKRGNSIPRSCFRDNGWQTASLRPPGFRKFGEGFGRTRGPDWNVANSQLPVSSAELQSIFASGWWASLFATVSPEEDLVETLKLAVLLDAGLQSYVVTVPTLPNGPWLSYSVGPSSVYVSNKIACFKPYL